MDIETFWGSLVEDYRIVVEKALEIIIPFVQTWSCESGFPVLVNIKTKNRNRLDVRNNMRVSPSDTVPKFDLLVNLNHEQRSHWL